MGYNEDLQGNNSDLKEILNTVNDLPDQNPATDVYNLATVDKITQVDTWHGEMSSVSDDGDGISWINEIGINVDQVETYSSPILQKIPLTAGRNVSFEYDEENNAISINATGGSSGDDSAIGTWALNNTIDPLPDGGYNFEFTSNGSDYTYITFGTLGPPVQVMRYGNDLAYGFNVSSSYGVEPGWQGEAYKTLDVTKEPTQIIKDWLKANGEKIGGGSSSEGNSSSLLQVTVSTSPETTMSEILNAIVEAGSAENSVVLVNLTGYTTGQYLMQFTNYGGPTYFAACSDIFTGEKIYSSQTGNVFNKYEKRIDEFINEGKTLRLPQIRYANCQLTTDQDGNPLFYRFTVENLGGGELTWGDKLQICCRRKFAGGKMKLRKMAEVDLTYEDFNSRFIKIEVDPNEGDVQKWLFRNDRIGNGTMSQIHFRLKRVTKWNDETGEECNAIFSNVETAWKTYILSGDFDCGYDLASLKIK